MEVEQAALEQATDAVDQVDDTSVGNQKRDVAKKRRRSTTPVLGILSLL